MLSLLTYPGIVLLLVNLTDIPVLLLLPSVTFRALQVEVVLCAQNACTAKYLNQGSSRKTCQTTAVGSTATAQVEFQQAASSVANLSGVTVAILGQAGGGTTQRSDWYT